MAVVSEIRRPPSFEKMADEFHVETLVSDLPYQWKHGARDSVDSVGTTLGATRDFELYRKCGCETWEEYCSRFLGDPAKAFDELIEGVRILRGLGIGGPISESAARAASKISPRQAIEQALPLSERQIGVEGGTPGPGRGKTADDVSRFTHGNGTSYLAARIKRDAPEIAERIDEFRSVRAAAVAAGIIHVKTPLEQLQHWWRKASVEEQAEFREWLTQQ